MAFFKLTTNFTMEDAMITFRYAQNIASGNGFVFNVGERVLGTTTPLLTLLLAAAGYIFSPENIILIASISMIGAGILTGWLIYLILQELNFDFPTRLLAVTLFFSRELFFTTATGGMETPLYLLCMAASLLTYIRQQINYCLLICAILVLIRPDGFIWSSLIGLAILFHNKQPPWKTILLVSCIILAWLSFATWYFGSPIPHSITAKQSIGYKTFQQLSFFSADRIKGFLYWYDNILGINRQASLDLFWLLILGLGAISLVKKTNKNKVGLIIISYSVLYAAFLYVGQAPHFPWYQTPALFCTSLLTAIGLIVLSHFISNQLQSLNQKLKLNPMIILYLVISLNIIHNQGIINKYFERQLNEVYTRAYIGTWIANNTPSESVVAMETIGYQGFYSKRKIIDLAGLVSPQVVAIKKITHTNGELFNKTLSQLKPNYIILRSFEIDENEYFHGGKVFDNVQQHDFFYAHYGECKRFSAPFPNRWGRFSNLTLYALKSDHNNIRAC